VCGWWGVRSEGVDGYEVEEGWMSGRGGNGWWVRVEEGRMSGRGVEMDLGMDSRNGVLKLTSLVEIYAVSVKSNVEVPVVACNTEQTRGCKDHWERDIIIDFTSPILKPSRTSCHTLPYLVTGRGVYLLANHHVPRTIHCHKQ
jgi:hypothetical protein